MFCGCLFPNPVVVKYLFLVSGLRICVDTMLLFLLSTELVLTTPPPPLLCISLTLQGPAVFAHTPVCHFALKVPTVETCWLTAALQRPAPSPLLWLSSVVRSGEDGGRTRERVRTSPRQPVVLRGQFRWLALKCKLKRASLCSFKVTRARQCNVKLSLPCLCCVRCGDWQKLLVIV